MRPAFWRSEVGNKLTCRQDEIWGIFSRLANQGICWSHIFNVKMCPSLDGVGLVRRCHSSMNLYIKSLFQWTGLGEEQGTLNTETIWWGQNIPEGRYWRWNRLTSHSTKADLGLYHLEGLMMPLYGWRGLQMDTIWSLRASTYLPVHVNLFHQHSENICGKTWIFTKV